MSVLTLLFVIVVAIAITLYVLPWFSNRDSTPSDELMRIRRNISMKYQSLMDRPYLVPSDEERDEMLRNMRVELEQDVARNGHSARLTAMPTSRGVCPDGYRHIRFSDCEMCLKLDPGDTVEVTPDFKFVAVSTIPAKNYRGASIAGVKFAVKQ